MGLESWYGECHPKSASIDASFFKDHVVDAKGERCLDEGFEVVDDGREIVAKNVVGIVDCLLPCG